MSQDTIEYNRSYNQYPHREREHVVIPMLCVWRRVLEDREVASLLRAAVNKSRFGSIHISAIHFVLSAPKYREGTLETA